ncbi:hypothetical protein CUJ83_07370 [Methanocella sp. CWC-04]|uniref:Uncharacterized protein n=1 Tax=Methanooceanicella nereidis TaxID=2052831 RepID=A0AAP2RCY1_9EURY|nr:hypothetical protein [Methanocella sp. CWC-04]MCD1294817.1 hypothetical protein [Methanocella sp. CWC-04]
MVRENDILDSLKNRLEFSLYNNRIVSKGKNIIDSRERYEELLHSKISRYSLPKMSMFYSNSKFKTSIYRAAEPSPCLDEILYKYEYLIPYGKEYWFAIFTSLDKKKPMQLVSSFGRRNTRKSIIDDIELNGLNSNTGELNTGAFVWCYDGKKKLAVPAVETKTIATGNSICSTGNGFDMSISGTVPEYRVSIDSDQIKCDFKVKKPLKGYDEEILNEMKMGLNYQVYNLYYDFEGTLNDKEYEGRCYLQKVILSTPLVPWNWSRLMFKDGSYFVFFKPYFGSKDIYYALRNKGMFYSAEHDRLFWINNIDVKNDSRMVNWKFRSECDGYSLNVAVKAYSHHKFSFKHGGTFNYNEFLVNVKKFDFQAEGIKTNIKKLGIGAGMVEDATGLLI